MTERFVFVHVCVCGCVCVFIFVFIFFVFTFHFIWRRENFCHRRRGSPRKLRKYWLVTLFKIRGPTMSFSNSTFVLDVKFSFKRCRSFAEVVIASHVTYLQMKKTLKRRKPLLWQQKSACQTSRCCQLNLKRFDTFVLLILFVFYTDWRLMICLTDFHKPW